jgi:site-specific DNA recombinase
MTRHLSYLRVSTDEQREKASVETQRELLERDFLARGIVCAGWYVDDGWSGTIPLPQRPDAARLLRDARPGDLVHVWKLDRLGRGARLTLNAIHELEQRGADTVSLTEPFDTSTTAGRFMRNMLAATAELERDLIVERTTEACHRLARAGVYLGGPCPPFGYRLEGEGRERRLVPDERTLLGVPPRTPAEIVRELYRALVDEQVSSLKLAQRLNAAQVPTSFGHRTRPHSRHSRPPSGMWGDNTIRQILGSPTYRGQRPYGIHSRQRRPVIYQEVPPLVDVELWQAAQIQLVMNQRNALRNAKQPYLLRGLLRCGECGRACVGVSKGNGSNIRYYRCVGKTQPKRPEERCLSRALRAARAEAVVWERLVTALQDRSGLLTRAAELLREGAPDAGQLERDHHSIIQALEGLAEQRHVVFGLRRRGLMTDADLERQLGEIDAEDVALRGRLAECISAEERTLRATEGLGKLERMIATWAERIESVLTPEDQARALHLWVERLVTDGDDLVLDLRLFH